MDWECPSCGTTAQTVHRPKGPMHDCPGHHGLSLALRPAGERSRIRVNEREDYLSRDDIPQTDGNGRPVMSVNTDFPDGRSALTLLMPTAIVRGSA